MHDGPPPADPPSPRRALLTAAALLALLAAVAWWLDLGRQERTVADLTVPLRASPTPTRGDPDAIVYAPDFDLDRTSTLTVTLEPPDAEGDLSIGCALLEQATGEVRALTLGVSQRRDAGGALARSPAQVATIDRVAPGAYSMRFEPWFRGEASAAPPPARVRVTAGGLRPLTFVLAAGIVVLPALISLGRWARWRLRRKDPEGGA